MKDFEGKVGPGISVKKRWSDEEIDSLKKMYFEGEQEKEIGLALGRTYFSVRKKIDMMKIRGHRGDGRVVRQKNKTKGFKPYFIRISKDNQGGDDLLKEFKKIFPNNKKRVAIKNVDMIAAMVDEMREGGMSVKKISEDKVKNYGINNSYEKRENLPVYMVGGVPVTIGQLLLRYNKMRESQKKPLFMASQLLNDTH